MTLEELEEIQNQAEVLDVNIITIDKLDGSYSVVVGSYSYSMYKNAMSALTTIYLKKNK